MSINPHDFDQNEAWILFQLNDAPVRTEMDGDFKFMAIMDVATGLMLGIEFVGIPTEELSEFACRKLLASAETEAGEYPQQLLVNSKQNAHQLATAANAKGIEVVSESESDLDPITKEAREGFTAHVSGTKTHWNLDAGVGVVIGDSVPCHSANWSYEMMLRYARLAPEHLADAAARIERRLEIVGHNATISLR